MPYKHIGSQALSRQGSQVTKQSMSGTTFRLDTMSPIQEGTADLYKRCELVLRPVKDPEDHIVFLLVAVTGWIVRMHCIAKALIHMPSWVHLCLRHEVAFVNNAMVQTGWGIVLPQLHSQNRPLAMLCLPQCVLAITGVNEAVTKHSADTS